MRRRDICGFIAPNHPCTEGNLAKIKATQKTDNRFRTAKFALLSKRVRKTRLLQSR